MIKAVTLETERLILKALSVEHITEEYLGWLNDERVYQYLESGGNYTFDQLISYVKDVQEKNIYFWAIHLRANNKHIGNIKIDPINIKHGLGEYGILMGDTNEWGKGFAKEASVCIIRYCFNELNLRKITLGVIADNTNAVNLYKKLGFTIEGNYIEHGIYGGKYCDCLRMALFNRNYISK